MGHRRLPNRAETLRVMRHLADVAALRSDPDAQRHLLIGGLAQLFDAPLSWLLVLDDVSGDRPLRPTLAIMPAGMDPFWQRYLAAFAAEVPVSADPYAKHILAGGDDDQHWTQGRVLPDLAAHRDHAAASQLVAEHGVCDGSVVALRLGGHRLLSLSWHRTHAEGTMSDRDHALHRLAGDEVRRLVDRGHLSLGPPPSLPPSPPPLPPRLRQVLDGIKVGQAPKAIARDLGLSVWTVRDHIKRLYAAHGVNGRDELMARFLRDGPR